MGKACRGVVVRNSGIPAEQDVGGMSGDSGDSWGNSRR